MFSIGFLALSAVFLPFTLNLSQDILIPSYIVMAAGGLIVYLRLYLLLRRAGRVLEKRGTRVDVKI
ncbi:hypothetical protein [Paenibacillus gansuensis]|uniref:Uncharacterized protein n=1 Tax=Paenibacillus gansuensis TaxID=306542 RepID=A0ABW5P9A6_9BACL